MFGKYWQSRAVTNTIRRVMSNNWKNIRMKYRRNDAGLHEQWQECKLLQCSLHSLTCHGMACWFTMVKRCCCLPVLFWCEWWHLKWRSVHGTMRWLSFVKLDDDNRFQIVCAYYDRMTPSHNHVAIITLPIYTFHLPYIKHTDVVGCGESTDVWNGYLAAASSWQDTNRRHSPCAV